VRRAAQAFLAASFGTRRWPALRFDVVAIDGERIEWIRAAF
jgi:Holliday junction resolvase-like predicted endonuclease